MTAPLDFEAFHRNELPKMLDAGNGELAHQALRRGSLAFRVGDASFTYAKGNDGVDVTAGDEAADVVIELTREEWSGIVSETLTAPGLLYSGRAKCLKGNAIGFVAFEPVLRAMYNGRAVWCEDDTLLDRNGGLLDPNQAFELSSDREDMAHFLRTAGFLVIRNVFAQDEVDGFLAEAGELEGEARKGDNLSWWGKNAAGEEVLTRITRAAAKPKLATLNNDPRMLSLVALSDHDLQARRRGQSEEEVALIFKRPVMSEGLSDLPWHRDCGMGGHAQVCPVMIASVFLTEASPQSGDLRMLPGSWQGSVPYMDATAPHAPRGVQIAARAGDVSLHYGDTMHAAPPPEDSDRDVFRISAVTGFAKSGIEMPKEKGGHNHVLHGREDGQIEHLSKVADRMSEPDDGGDLT